MKVAGVYKGWVAGDTNPKNLISRSEYGVYATNVAFAKSKHTKGWWTNDGEYPEAWPPKRVTITVEVD